MLLFERYFNGMWVEGGVLEVWVNRTFVVVGLCVVHNLEQADSWHINVVGLLESSFILL